MSANFTYPKIEWRSPQTLTPYFNNTKAHPVGHVDKIAASIAEFGFDQPIVVDEQGVILKGHGRREASIRLGLEQVPVIVRTDLTELQKKACRIADNKVAESEWLEDELRLELLELQDQDYDLHLTGFDEDVILKLLVDESEDPFDQIEDMDDRNSDIQPQNASCTIGEYRFTLERERYLQWQEAIRQSVGFDEDSIIAEIQRRLEL
ncbi:MAG: ParB/Srx family N-terminal domain-containing protein [Leptolyngbyaceae cyanobacterium bins.302]|nr:ParB/Srx family N-terminal domain-containing protein [Leptolyngbyaceae cyanobacterium bins.302]